ncbi:EMILIN-2-like [Conger conger]|uniref:EMILIN-2-like n=1 Tax=Conger conger TaxID=82655 RepID=UPI002A5A999C|nr:EMILIN-2-like [Conger conger]
MERYLIESIVRCSVLSLLLAGVLIQATPSYDLFQGSAYSGGGTRQRNKNWCARVVYKNVTCAVLGSAESFLEPEPAPCPPHQPDCVQRLMYRTQFRPTYRIAYKTVTQLEWRCCPGFQGADCMELKGPIPAQRPHPYPQPIPGQVQHRPRPSHQDWGQGGGQGGDRVRRLEGEVDQLSQTVRDLQAALTGLNENLRLDVQEDTSKMLLTLLNTLHLPVSDLTAGSTEHVQLVSHAHPPQGHAPSPDSPAQGPAPSSDGPAPSSDGPAPSSRDPLHSVMESRFQQLRAELLESVEVKMAALQDRCDPARSARGRCEQQGYRSLAQQLDRKEAGLREEIRQLRLHMAPGEEGAVRTLRGANEVSDLRREVVRLADAHRALNARVDNEVEHLSALNIEGLFAPRLEELEGRINVTERNAETLCFYVDDKLSRRIANETDALRALLGSTEDQFSAMLVEIANGNHSDADGDGDGGSLGPDGVEEVLRDARTNGRQIQSLEQKLNALARQCSAGCGGGAGAGPGAYDDLLREVRVLGSELDAARAETNGDAEKLRDLEGLLRRQLLIGQHNSRNLADQQAGLLAARGEVGALRGDVDRLAEALVQQAEEVRGLNASCGPQAGGAGREEAPGGSPVDELRLRLDQLSREVRAELARRRADAGGPAGGDVPSSLQRVADTLNRHTASVWARVQQLHAAQRTQAQGITALATSLHLLQTQLAGHARNTPGTTATAPGRPVLNGVKESPGSAAETRPLPPASPLAPRPGGVSIVPHIQIPLNPNQSPPLSHLPLSPSRPHLPSSNSLPPSQPLQPSNPLAPHRPHLPAPPPRRPVTETGEAGPPGTVPRIGVRVSLTPDTPNEPEQGYAGAPGYPPLRPVSFRPNIVPVAFLPRKHADRPFVTPVSAGGAGVSEPFSFSAGLTAVPLPWLMGVIRFDRVLVNDGGHYNPRTGIFTAPQEGRYLVSAVLTPQLGERVEGALSVSDRSVQRLASPGPGPAPGPGPGPCACAGPASVSLVLPLRRGDRLAVVRTAGRLAVSEPREVLSTFSALFLYAAPALR